MKKSHIAIIGLVIIWHFFVVYSIHFNNPFPLHIDEWKHINEAKNLNDNGLINATKNLELGFQLFLAFLWNFSDLILIYKFLPAIWAVLTGAILFLIVKHKTENFTLAILAWLFFASIKSNANITGMIYFTPLTFAIPFIFLYMHFITEGIKNEKKLQILLGFILILFLIPIHAPSVLFSIPILLIYCLYNINYLIKERRFFSIFLLIPIFSFLFYAFFMGQGFLEVLINATDLLTFEKGWGVLEINNSPNELYSPIAYFLAGLGFILVIKKELKKHSLNIIWPIMIFAMILYFRINGISYLSPYQRNLYYFAISLPFLSAYGAYNLINYLKKYLNSKLTMKNKELIIKTTLIIIVLLILFLTFLNYHSRPQQIEVYKIISSDQYEALLFLKNQPQGLVLADPLVSSAVYGVSGQKALASTYFNANKLADSRTFFISESCEKKLEIINKNKIKYILADKNLNCNLTLIYSNNTFIYKTNVKI